MAQALLNYLPIQATNQQTIEHCVPAHAQNVEACICDVLARFVRNQSSGLALGKFGEQWPIRVTAWMREAGWAE